MTKEIEFSKAYRGRRAPGTKVLDVGAGFTVDSRATHAIDKFHSPKGGGSDIPSKGSISDVEYYPKDVDVVKEGLPYSSGEFDLVVSYGSFGWNFGNIKTAKELRRVLKVGGLVELGVSKDNLSWVLDTLRKAGFRDIQVTPNEDETYKVMAEKR